MLAFVLVAVKSHWPRKTTVLELIWLNARALQDVQMLDNLPQGFLIEKSEFLQGYSQQLVTPQARNTLTSLTGISRNRSYLQAIRGEGHSHELQFQLTG
jgi:hypothetical protein